jgi:rhodanese-related sulfurtransferase
MARFIDRAQVRRLMANESAQLVEVLPRDEYELEHIAGAVNVPLKELNPDSARSLNRNRPVIVYCEDFL